MVKVLGIESSCDETSCAVVVDGASVLSNVVASQVPLHAKYGGVVPELASRAHIVDVVPVVRQALSEAGVALDEIDGVAVTQGPGLVGSLLVGIETAKALAYRLQRPMVGVHHIEAHLMAAAMAVEPGWDSLTMPFVGLVVSGGHTSLFRVDGFGAYRCLGATRDDAAGEALDKVGKMLGLPYPGGVYIDKTAVGGDVARHDFPRAMRRRDNLEFSFSGLKTSVRTWLEKRGSVPEGDDLRDLCASVQEAVVDILVFKLLAAARSEGVSCVAISGGVSANSRLRERVKMDGRRAGLAVVAPPFSLCTDNAGMIAGLGHHYLALLEDASFDAFDLNARPSWPLG